MLKSGEIDLSEACSPNELEHLNSFPRIHIKDPSVADGLYNPRAEESDPDNPSAH